MSQNAADRGDWMVPPALPRGPVFNPPRGWRGRGCNGLCVRAYDLLEGYGSGVVYPHPECPEHGMWDMDLDTESKPWFDGSMTTVLFENSDYDLTDLEDRFDLYRQADGVSTLDRGLHLVFDEHIDPISPGGLAD